MSTDYLKKPIFRMVHIGNLEYLLRNGICTRNHVLADPGYISIGNSEIIQRRSHNPVRIDPPGGELGDYVPFYFGGHSPMLLNIKTGYGVEQRDQADLVFIVCIIEDIIRNCSEWCFTDGHGKKVITSFYNSTDDLDKIDWVAVHAQYWYDCEEDWDRSRKKQAEFLIRNYVPVSCIKCLIVFNGQRKKAVDNMVFHLGLNIPVHVDTKKQLFYR